MEKLVGMAQITVVVVDGQRTFADALAARLAVEGGLTVVATAGSVESVHRLLVGRHVDVALLDAELPEVLRLAAELAGVRISAPRPVRVIMLGTMPGAARLVEALRAGIAGWVPKEESIGHLLETIRSVMHNETRLPPTALGPVLQLLLDEYDGHASPKHPLMALTPREQEVLSYLAEGISRREVAERMHLSCHTVRSHLQNLMGKLDVHTTLEAVALARQTQRGQTHPMAASWF
jgi:DNA-binding NarL/FixJ family response regulator